MASLFIDTTHAIEVGLLDESYSWLDYQSYDSKKSSAHLHHFINEILERNALSLTELECIFYCAGPGSYTGMRVSEGLTNVLGWQGVKINSFYHFELPKISGVESGVWFSSAFKGESFVYRWGENGNSSELIENKNLDMYLDKEESYSFVTDGSIQGTKELIYNNPTKIFNYINELDLKRELYYYRPIEKEFSREK